MPRSLFVTIALILSLVVVAPAAAHDEPADTNETEPELALVTDQVTAYHLDQVTRLYLTTLGREPGPAGQAYWAQLLVNGHTRIAVIRYMLATPEAQSATSGDLLVDAYRNALGRTPDSGGYDFWSQFDPVAAVAAISDSAEHIAKTDTLPPPTPGIRSFAGRAGWVDAGHGVFVPPVMLAIRHCESTDNYQARNPRSTARGAYQFLTGSWQAYGHADRYSAATALYATPAEQDEAAVITWLADGTRPWNASRHCWG